VNEVIAGLRRQLADLADQLDDATAVESIQALVDLNELNRDLGRLRSILERQAHSRMSMIRLEVPGVGPVLKSRTGVSDRFDSDGLLAAVLDKAAVDEETGEIVLDAAARATVTRALNRCLPLTASLGWRKTGLTELLGRGWQRKYLTQSAGEPALKLP